MDKVQIYEAVLISLALITSFIMDGKPKPASTYSLKTDLIVLLFALPVIGRIFLWW